MDRISSFRGEYDFLSNFYGCTVNYGGITYKHTEGAFQAQKTHDEEKKWYVATLSAADSKKACGRRGLGGFKLELRPDWEDVKDNIMFEIVCAKFEQNPELCEKLLATGDAELVEGNTWHDNYWGDCSCERCKNTPGKNMLGKTLMMIRQRLEQ